MTIRTTLALPPVHPFLGIDLISALVERVELRGDHPLLIWEPFEGAPRTWTYAQFHRDVMATAAGLASRGVGVGDVIVNHLDNSPGFLLTLFACAHLGAVSVNLNTRYVEDELAHAVKLTGATGMVTDPRLGLASGRSAAALDWVVELDPITGTIPDLEGEPRQATRCAADPARPLSVQLTSGTTSRPKAVLYTHANALWGARAGAAHWRMQPDAVMLVCAPLFHTMALSWQFLSTFWAGGTVVLQPKFSATRLWEVSARHRCTHTALVLPMLRFFEAVPPPAHTFRFMSVAAENPALEDLLGLRCVPFYGMTELVSQAIVGDPLVREQAGVVGRAAGEYAIRIVDENGDNVAPGATGDLVVGGVRGISLFAEYLNDSAATADAFDAQGCFRTGDRVTLHPDGSIAFASRAKDMLKPSGENVAAAEIERVVATVAGVLECAVVGAPDAKHGEAPVAFIVPREGFDGSDLRRAVVDACARGLADFKRPRDIHLIDELPRATLDKVAKGALKSMALELSAG